MTTDAEWRAAIAAAPTDGCKALFALYLFDGWPLPEGEGGPLLEAMHADPLLEWRIAIALARRGKPQWLAGIVTVGPTPLPLWTEVRNVLGHPVAPRRGPHRPSKLPLVEVGTLSVQLLNVKSRAERVQCIKDFAGKHNVDEKTVRRELARHKPRTSGHTPP